MAGYLLSKQLHNAASVNDTEPNIPLTLIGFQTYLYSLKLINIGNPTQSIRVNILANPFSGCEVQIASTNILITSGAVTCLLFVSVVATVEIQYSIQFVDTNLTITDFLQGVG